MEQWAVCPKFDIEGKPRLFRSEANAGVWLETHGPGGWLPEPLAVVSRLHCIGAEFVGPRLCEWHRPEDPTPLFSGGATSDEMEQSILFELRGQTVWPTCCLAKDWSFDTLEAAVWRSQGHDYVSWRSASAAGILFLAICDFDAVIRSAFAGAPASLIASFYQSWQLHRHLHRLCDDLKHSKVVRDLQVTESDWNAGKWAVARALNTYARHVLMLPPVTAIGEGAVRPLPIAESLPAKTEKPKIRVGRWEAIECIIDDHSIEIRVSGMSVGYGYQEFGCEDKRTGNPDEQWALLQMLGKLHGVLPDDTREGKVWLTVGKRVERLRKVLQKRFELTGDPIPYDKGRGYRARFKIRRVPDAPQAAP